MQPSAAPTPEKPRSEQAEPPSPAVMRGLQEEAGESEATIERALYIGNYAAAVDACIKVRVMLRFIVSLMTGMRLQSTACDCLLGEDTPLFKYLACNLPTPLSKALQGYRMR